MHNANIQLIRTQQAINKARQVIKAINVMFTNYCYYYCLPAPRSPAFLQHNNRLLEPNQLSLFFVSVAFSSSSLHCREKQQATGDWIL